MTKKRQRVKRISGAVVKSLALTSARSPSPPLQPMLRPGAVELPQPPQSSVTLAAVAHSMQVDARRKFATTYEDIAQYIDKCEYLFDHDDFYYKSYKSLARTVAELNKLGTDSQQQERDQLYNGLLDWLSTSTFAMEALTQGIINEHQLIESAQITRDILVKVLLSIERLRVLHMAIVDKIHSTVSADLELKQTEKSTSDNKRKLLKIVDDSSFVWKTAAAEIVQLLHEERNKGGEVVELYADKIRYLMGELEAQASMIQELRLQLDQQEQLPLKLHDLNMKAKRAQYDAATAASRQAKQSASAAGKHQPNADDDDIVEDDIHSAAKLPDFNKQLVMTLHNELEECRRQNAGVVARGHEAAAKIRFLTEEGNRKDKQIAQLQANITKLKTESREAESESQKADDSKHFSDKQRRLTRRKSTDKVGRRGRRTFDSIELQDTGNAEQDEKSEGRMKLTQLIAAAKRQKRSSQPSTSPTAPQRIRQSTVAASSGVAAPTMTSTKPGKSNRTPRARARVHGGGGGNAAEQTQTAPDQRTIEQKPTVSLPKAPTFQEMGSFWQQSKIKEWTQASVDNSAASTAVATQRTPLKHDVAMNEAIEMTQLFLAAGSKILQLQQPQYQTHAVKGRRASVQQQQQRRSAPTATQTHVTAFSPQLFAESNSKAITKATSVHDQRQHNPIVADENYEAVSWREQHRARTADEAAKMRAARLSATLFHSVSGERDRQPIVQPRAISATTTKSTTMTFKPLLVEQQPQQQNMQASTKNRPTPMTTKAAGYNLVGVNVHNLAQQAKLLKDGSVPKFLPRLS